MARPPSTSLESLESTLVVMICFSRAVRLLFLAELRLLAAAAERRERSRSVPLDVE